MSSTALTILRCDRCGTRVTVEQAADRAGWCVIAGVLDGKSSGAIAGDDLCPGCVSQLQIWWCEAKEPVQAPAPPPARPKRGLTKAEQEEVWTLAEDVFREQLEHALRYYSDSPTELLSGVRSEQPFVGLRERTRRIAGLVTSIMARGRK